MSMPINLILVRHGESEGNVARKRFEKGDKDAYSADFVSRHTSKWRLTDKGIEQARTAGEWIKKNISSRFDRYYTSEYIRAIETAHYLGFKDAKWLTDFYLRERDWGKMDRLAAEDPEAYEKEIGRKKVEGIFWNPLWSGESMAQFSIRKDRVFDTLHRECANMSVLIVCHGEVMWAARLRLERMSQERYQALEISKDPRDHIHNGQVIQYTRRIPGTRDITPYYYWMRSIWPDNPNCTHGWQKIERPIYSNEDLLKIAQRFPRLIAG